MIKIDKHNVEAYYLDYLEGNLSEKDTSALFLFIEENPEIAELFDDLDDILDFKLEPEDISFSDASTLKVKSSDNADISLSNIDTWLIAKAEKTLSREEEQAVNEFVKANKLEQNEAYVNATYLKPDLSEVYGNRNNLKTPQFKSEIDISNIDYWLIAKSEKTLSYEQEQAVDQFIKHSGLEENEAYVNAAYLKPNLSEVFGDTSALKKETEGKIIPLLVRVVSIAAIFVFLWLIFRPNKSIEPSYYSRSNNMVKQIEPVYESQTLVTDVEPSAKTNLASNIKISSAQKSKANSGKQKSVFSNKEPINLFEENFVSLTTKKEFNNPPSWIPENINISHLFADFEETIASQNKPSIIKDVQSDDLANVDTKISKSQLKEQYRPVTRTLSNLTQLDMSYKKAPEESDFAQTVIQIGSFSFERKRKK